MSLLISFPGIELQATRVIVGGAPCWLVKAPSGELECKDNDLSKSITLRGQDGGVRLVREVQAIVVQEEKVSDEVASKMELTVCERGEHVIMSLHSTLYSCISHS